MNSKLFRNLEGEIVQGGIIAVDADALTSVSVIRNLANLKKTWKWRVILISKWSESYLDCMIDACKAKGLEFDAVNANLPGSFIDVHNGECNLNYIHADVYLGAEMINVTEFEQRIVI